MATLALLSGANPRTCAIGPKVRLQPAIWTFINHGIRNSKLWLHVESPDGSGTKININDCEQFELIESTNVQVMFEERGIENHISVFVKRVA